MTAAVIGAAAGAFAGGLLAGAVLARKLINLGARLGRQLDLASLQDAISRSEATRRGGSEGDGG